MSAQFTVAFEDLAKYRAALRAVSAELGRELQKTLKAAVGLAARDAQERYGRRYRNRSGKTVAKIRAAATQTSAGVQFGGARFPWVAGQEFGSDRYPQFRPFTGRGDSAGRFIFPAVRKQAEPVARELERAFDALARRAYPEL